MSRDLSLTAEKYNCTYGAVPNNTRTSNRICDRYHAGGTRLVCSECGIVQRLLNLHHTRETFIHTVIRRAAQLHNVQNLWVDSLNCRRERIPWST